MNATDADPDLLRAAESAYQAARADPAAYLAPAADLVARARTARHHEAHVVALRAQGWAVHALLDNVAALPLLTLAARIASRQHLTARLAEVLISRAAVHHELGHLGAAQRDLDRAAHVAQGPLRCEVALQQAALHHNQGRLADAEAVYRRTLADDGCPLDVRVKMANNLGHLLAARGRALAGLRQLDQVREDADRLGPVFAAGVTQTRAWALLQAGRLGDSVREFELAGQRFRAAGLPLADFWLEYADTLADLRLLGEAAAATERAAQELDRHGAQLMAAEAHLRRARLALLMDDVPAAVGAADLAVDRLRRQRREAWLAEAAVTAAQAHAGAGTLAPAHLAGLRRAAATLDRLGMQSGAVDANLALGRIAGQLGRAPLADRALRRAHVLSRGGPVLVRLNGRLAAALAQPDRAQLLRHCRAGLDDLAEHRAALPSMELRALASGHGAELGRLGLAALVPTGSAARVLDWMERTRAAALVSVDPPLPPELTDDLARLRAVTEELRQARRSGDGEPARLLARQAAVEARIRRATWTARRVPDGSRQDGAQPGHRPDRGDRPGAEHRQRHRRGTVARLRAGLGEAVLAEYAVLDGQVLAVVLDRRRARLLALGPVAAVAAERDALAFALRRITRARRSAAAAVTDAGSALARLARLLIHPLSTEPGRELVVVPSDLLHGVPWSPLHPGPVSLAPSAAFWLRTGEPAAAAAPVALIAGPDLPGAAAEVAGLAALHPAPVRLLPPASTVAAVTRALAGTDLAHVACHGLLRTDNPTFSALQLSDGPLTVHELAAQGPPARRIVLAACESGAQVAYPGNEVLGFVGALMARGTAGLVASTVPVPDGDSVPLMRALHGRLREGRSLATALHSARQQSGQAAADFADRPGELIGWCGYTAYGAA